MRAGLDTNLIVDGLTDDASTALAILHDDVEIWVKAPKVLQLSALTRAQKASLRRNKKYSGLWPRACPNHT